MTYHVSEQAAGIVNCLYSLWKKEAGRELNRLVPLCRKIVKQTTEILSG
jgi:hypothetical protein